MCVCVYIYICIYVHTHTHIILHLFVCVCVCIYIYIYKCVCIMFIFCMHKCVNTSGHEVKGVGLWPLACWDCRFESHWGHSCLSLVSVACCQVEVSVLD